MYQATLDENIKLRKEILAVKQQTEQLQQHLKRLGIVSCPDLSFHNDRSIEAYMNTYGVHSTDSIGEMPCSKQIKTEQTIKQEPCRHEEIPSLHKHVNYSEDFLTVKQESCSSTVSNPLFDCLRNTYQLPLMTEESFQIVPSQSHPLSLESFSSEHIPTTFSQHISTHEDFKIEATECRNEESMHTCTNITQAFDPTW